MLLLILGVVGIAIIFFGSWLAPSSGGAPALTGSEDGGDPQLSGRGTGLIVIGAAMLITAILLWMYLLARGNL